MPNDELNNPTGTIDLPAVDAAPAAPAPVKDAVPVDRDLSEIYRPDEAVADAADLGERLLADGVLTAEQLTQARRVQQQTPGRRLADIAVDQGAAPNAVQRIVADLAGLPFETIAPSDVDEKLFHRLGAEYCKTNQVIPLRVTGARIIVGVTNAQRLFMLDEVRAKLGKPLKVVLVAADDLATVLESFSEEHIVDVAVDDIIKDIQEDDVELVEVEEEDLDLERQAGESPVIRFVNYMISDATHNGASDIHIEPQENRLRLRYRIDGMLFEMMNPPARMHAAIVSRLKVMANLDISERRLPQDGRIRAVVHGRKLDLRLSTLPTAQGEKAVLRILDARSIQVSLEQLGMPEDTLVAWRNQITQPHGIILVTGPTGSGKTTTLYSSITQMDRGKLNISTVEDPVEYHLGGINQVQSYERIGLSFAAALRSLLRQDPDVIMIGEIRDEETARIAVQAALTGHLVLSTLHTNDAPSTVTRLINIGVEPYLISAALNGVLAQRLVRKICENCKAPADIGDDLLEHLQMYGLAADQLFKGAGCDKCHNTGYSGRVGVYELLLLDDTLRDKINHSPSVSEFRRLCVERGMITLRVDGFRKVTEGVTTVEEVMRVTQQAF